MIRPQTRTQPAQYGFYAAYHPDTKVTTYGITLDHCPLDTPEPWLEELLFYLPYGDTLDLQHSATDFVLDYQAAKEALDLAAHAG